MDVFRLREKLIGEYADYVRSFAPVRAENLARRVHEELDGGLLWPDPQISLNPAFEPGETIDELEDRGVLDECCRDIFRIKRPGEPSRPLRLFRHPVEAIVVYPLNALANSQEIELIYTAWDLAGFASDLGYGGPPFRWDEERRTLLRAELDACLFHLYGIERNDVASIMSTFPIVRSHGEAAHGEYRTARLILEHDDAMTKVADSGQPYATALDPPPADSRVAHPR